MSKEIRGQDLLNWGVPQGSLFSPILKVAKNWSSTKTSFKTSLFQVLRYPERYSKNDFWAPVALEAARIEEKESRHHSLNEKGVHFSVFGEDIIEQGALDQMNIASRLPVAVTGALMPDAHQGYGLPIGGVLATKNAVIPYAVGVDIGCRMDMSIYDLNVNNIHEYISANIERLSSILKRNTVFGAGNFHEKRQNHHLLDDDRFNNIPFIKNRNLRNIAITQLGSSGSGNHFVEFGVLHMEGKDYFAILSHSGSRGFGAQIAKFYTDLAMEACKLPQEAKHLAFMSLDTENGQEYWEAMNLAGDYAAACHQVIHENLSKAIGEKPFRTFRNAHNLAWVENFNGENLIVHRKGATPANKGQYGIIPGSMTTKTYLVKGRGDISSLNSSSHGAGRKMSRKAAKSSISKNKMEKDLKKNNVFLIGGSLDECSFAYKDIDEVMKYQEKLVNIVGTFRARVVRMAAEKE